MPIADDEREFRLRPRKPPIPRNNGEDRAWALLFKTVMHHARMTRVRKSAGNGVSGGARRGSFNQRCAVRVMYSRNSVKGQWRAHGRYLARESANQQSKSGDVGLDDNRENLDLAGILNEWQKAGDERLWKLIVSPEFADRLDLNQLTRELMARMEADLNTSLEWVAVAHFNTEHPHVHIALRGIDARGKALHLDRDYVKRGIREIAESLCTQQLGYRTELDAAEAERREVHQQRYTSLDRIISRQAESDSDSLIYKPKRAHDGRESARLRQQRVSERLVQLSQMGLAERLAPDRWRVRGDFETTLRAMQRINDRQKILAKHGALVSDQRLPVTVLDFRQLTSVEGRILVHGEEDLGRNYLMLEGTDARIHLIYHTPEVAEARSRGGLKPNYFIRLRKRFAEKKPVLEIQELGDAEAVLRSRQHLKQTARSLIRRGVIPEEDGWGGWLGRYQAAVKSAVLEELDRQHRVGGTDRNVDLSR